MARELWERLAREPTSRWAAFAMVPVLWLALAWRDPLVLVAVPVLALGPVLAMRLRGDEEPDDFVL